VRRQLPGPGCEVDDCTPSAPSAGTGATTRAISRLSRGTSKYIGASLCCCCCCCCCCCWCRCCCWCGAALRLDSTRASRASDAAGGVAGGSGGGSRAEVEAGGCGGPLSLFNGRVRGLGVNREAGGSTWRRRTVGHRGDGPAGGAPGRSGWSHPVGGTEASGTLHSTLSS